MWPWDAPPAVPPTPVCRVTAHAPRPCPLALFLALLRERPPPFSQGWVCVCVPGVVVMAEGAGLPNPVRSCVQALVDERGTPSPQTRRSENEPGRGAVALRSWGAPGAWCLCLDRVLEKVGQQSSRNLPAAESSQSTQSGPA